MDVNGFNTVFTNRKAKAVALAFFIYFLNINTIISIYHRAIKKYGWDNFEHIIFAEGLSKLDAHRTECSLIALWKSNKTFYKFNFIII